MATTITRTGGDTVIARTGLTDITITSTTDVEITYNAEELWINILVLGADDAPIALEVADITTVNGVDVTGYTIEQLVTYIADNCFGIINEINGNLTITGTTLNIGNNTIVDSYTGNSSTYRVLVLTDQTINTNLGLNYNPVSNIGGSFNGTGQIFIAHNKGILASNAVGNNYIGVLRPISTGVYFGGSLSSGELTGDGLFIKNNGVINIPNIPTSSAGLVTGDLWNDGGTLKIV